MSDEVHTQDRMKSQMQAQVESPIQKLYPTMSQNLEQLGHQLHGVYRTGADQRYESYEPSPSLEDDLEMPLRRRSVNMESFVVCSEESDSTLVLGHKEEVEVEMEEEDECSSQNNGMNENSYEYREGGYHPVAVGDIFHNRYYAISKLGWGQFSTVWLCFDAQLERYCAVKVVKSGDQFMETARDEIRLLRAVDDCDWHPLRHRLVEFLDQFYVTGPHGRHLCLVFEVLGDNLLTLIQRSGYQGLPLWNIKQIALQVLEGLCFLHEHCEIIHTDLKPENVLLVADDVAIRGLASQAATDFLGVHSQKQQLHRTRHGPGSVRHSHRSAQDDHVKLTKTAKRKMRAQAKRSVTFFQEHRQWLRKRAIEDLLGLAAQGLLQPMTAVEGVTGQLPFMPFSFDGLVILEDSDLRDLELELEDDESMWDRDDVPAPGTLTRSYSLPNIPRRRQWNSALPANPVRSSALRLLSHSPEEFMRFVQEKVTESDLAEQNRHQPGRKQKGARKHSKGTRKKSSYSAKAEKHKDNSKEPNWGIIASRDPATQDCELKLKIADMGNGCWFDRHYTDDIQTREYRSVEVILGAGYNETADIWSAACLFWELATGKYLFDPQVRRGRASQDEVHIASIIETCGPIPYNLIDVGDYSMEVFKPSGQLRNIAHLQPRSLVDVLVNQHGWARLEAKDFVSFLEPMLQTDPRKRISALDALRHRWLHQPLHCRDTPDPRASIQVPDESHA
ncbi:uncharacterized protein LOC128265831 [Drosophila gunungcola]|uniref:non-specific serine/threonine protein kinase n=1 Tax=Drosophila gunungcola TaxID=103775 RepID=A0A9Q0BIU3_9MUSC|nr:uncharacterized protein LOC128265831 [Drosophila gunungcola]KAI8033230.1 hypothetical protein M5D96_014019 [Drosophila gunungcola]